MGGCVQIIPRISPMLGMHIVRVVVIDANHTYAHTKGPSEGIENKTSASFKYAMTFSCQDKRGLVPTRPKPLSMILLVLDELKLCLQPMCSGVKKYVLEAFLLLIFHKIFCFILDALDSYIHIS